VFCFYQFFILSAVADTDRSGGGGKIKVLIDPGHGGEDEGASKNGIKEKISRFKWR